MPRITFTNNLKRHVECPELHVKGGTIREALEVVFVGNPKLRSYLIDDQGALHKHMIIMLNGTAVTDRTELLQAVADTDELYVMQSLSGG